VRKGDQAGLTRSGEASTTTEAFVAQEMMKPNGLACRLRLGVGSPITGYGSTQGAVGRPAKVGHQPGPGR